ncbi:MAG: hypothetical protein U0U09_11980 [Cyclobacteriaceae bacterium]
MAIRRLQYQIDYVHIITFKEEYKEAVAPYFAFDNLEYGVDNESTIHESIRLIFKSENIAIILRKEGITFIYEGDVEGLRNQNGIIKIFWDLYEKVKLFKGYSKTVRHHIVAHSVVLSDQEVIDSVIEKKQYLNLNPFGKLDEFACIYQFKKDEFEYKFHFGNYSNKDIKNHDLTPFKTDYNSDLLNSVGFMGRLEIFEVEKTPTFSKFKSLLSKAENVFKEFSLDE